MALIPEEKKILESKRDLHNKETQEYRAATYQAGWIMSHVTVLAKLCVAIRVSTIHE